MDILEFFDCVQHIDKPTHNSGHLLDYIITRKDSSGVSNLYVSDFISDHRALHVSLTCSRAHPERKQIEVRSLKRIQCDVLEADLIGVNIDGECTDVNLVVRQYDASLSSLLDKHAPSKRIYVVERPMNDWMTDDILVLKALRRKYESLWRKTRLTVHFDMYSESCMDVKTAISNSKSEILQKKISCKSSVVIPLIKKSGLDREMLTNYRPVSNLSFLSKVIEKVISIRILGHILDNNIVDSFQSAYRACHSCETALLRVYNDIVTTVGKGNGSFLVLLDLSAAFDTIDHDNLFYILEKYVGIGGSALRLIRSYFSDRTQRAEIDGILSDLASLLCGVPQGSVLGPNLVCICFHLVRYLNSIILAITSTRMTPNSTFQLSVRILWNH